ncbi:uncharacterized protein LOC133197918 [Saccostrea echinata]|uniref:uncharacterized protein LOC133197918 n=1 Tax=Saccostrea echinata TaxID=191078 RepID=UPI002A802752|nr:uncharacterized protein LOC133197918 [Saccostrea echinata]
MKVFSISQGSLLKSITTKSGCIPEDIAVTKHGHLVYTDPRDRTVNIVKNRKIKTGYLRSTVKAAFDDEGKPLFSYGYTKYISENKNLDICVADNNAEAVVVVNLAGKLRFRYNGHKSALGSKSHILTADSVNNCVHIIDQNGHS